MSDFIWNIEKQTYEVAKEGLVELAKKKIDEYDLSKLVIETEEDYKRVWQARTQLNTLIKDLATKRKQMEAIVLNTFKPTCVAVEKYGAGVSEEMTKNLNAFKPKEQKTKMFSITIKCEDLKVIKKFESMALKYNCQITTKEG